MRRRASDGIGQAQNESATKPAGLSTICQEADYLGGIFFEGHGFRPRKDRESAMVSFLRFWEFLIYFLVCFEKGVWGVSLIPCFLCSSGSYSFSSILVAICPQIGNT